MARRKTSEPEKKTRRGQGSGAAFQRSEDGMWVASLDIGWQAGKRKRKYFYAKTESAVLEKLAKARGDQLQGKDIDPDRITVEQYLKQWLEEDVKRRLAITTYENYEGTMRVHVYPDLGKFQLTKLSPRHVQLLLRSKEEAGLSPRSVANIRTVLGIALHRAMKWELIHRNVARLVDAPNQRKVEVVPWSRAEAFQFLKHVETHRLGALFTVALSLGMRRGEALGIKWEDIDFETRTLSIRRQVVRTRTQGLVIKEPKTEKSRRTIALPEQTITRLKQHRRIQAAEQLRAGPRWHDEGYVFTSTIGTPVDPRNVSRLYNELRDAAGVSKKRFHDQRHWCATLLLAQGVSMLHVKELLGHTLLSTTMDLYGHLLEEDRRISADSMDEIFRGKMGA
jgi:integrase